MEIMRLLVNHPEVEEIKPVSRTYAGDPVSKHLTQFRGFLDEKFQKPDYDQLDTDFLFVAAPPGDWIKEIPSVLDRGIKVISMGGKFRIKDPEIDSRLYPGVENKELLQERVYGLPELNREKIKKARFIANPGCYTTSIILGLAPLPKYEEKIDHEKICVSSVSGTSGAGAKPSGKLHHPEMVANYKPYKVVKHRHAPEMEFVLNQFFESDLSISFTPAVGNHSRGIISTINVFGKTGDLSREYEKFYAKEKFVRVLDEEKENVPNLKDVVNTNYLDLGFNYDSKRERALILSASDNLIKGGSGTGVQNMNLMSGLEEKQGLENTALRP